MIERNPLVSVLIPCYNVAPYIERSVDSILSQDYPNLEVWLIDDASTDDTLQQLNNFKDKRIRVVAFEKNTQKIGAVNNVLGKVNGDFIVFQDADDWSEPGRIREQLTQFSKDPVLGICFTNFRYVSKKTYLPGRIALTNEELRKGFLEYDKQKNIDFLLPLCGTMMISKAALEATGGYHEYFIGRVAEDIHWVYRILKQFKGITVNKILYHYCFRLGSLTQLQSVGKSAKFAYSWDLLAKIIYQDIHEGIDILDPDNSELLNKLELAACETALVENIQLLNTTKVSYEKSLSFRIGKFILTPWRLFKLSKNQL